MCTPDYEYLVDHLNISPVEVLSGVWHLLEAGVLSEVDLGTGVGTIGGYRFNAHALLPAHKSLLPEVAKAMGEEMRAGENMMMERQLHVAADYKYSAYWWAKGEVMRARELLSK